MTDRYTALLHTFEQTPMEELACYFHDNAESIDSLIQLYEAYNKHVMNAQARRIRELRKSICQLTGDDGWSDIEGLELSYDEFEPRIYIRGSFSSGPEDPLATFTIHLLAPTVQAWNHYEDRLLGQYPTEEPLIAGNKTILQVFTVPGQQQEQVLKALQEVYLFLSSLTFRNFFPSLTSH